MTRKDFNDTCFVPTRDVAGVASKVDNILRGAKESDVPVKLVPLGTHEGRMQSTDQRVQNTLSNINKITRTVQCVGYNAPIVFRKPLTDAMRNALLYDEAQVAAYYRLTINGVRYTHSGRVRYNATTNTFHFTDTVRRSKA